MKLSSIPWRKVGRWIRDTALLVIRATGKEPPSPSPKEPTPSEAFDRWKDGRL